MDAEDKARTLHSWRVPPIEVNAGLTGADAMSFGRWMQQKPFGYMLNGEATSGSDESYFETWLLVAFLAGHDYGRRR